MPYLPYNSSNPYNNSYPYDGYYNEVVASGFTSYATALTYNPVVIIGDVLYVNASYATGTTCDPALSLGSSQNVNTSIASAITLQASTFLGLGTTASGFTSYATGLTYTPNLSFGSLVSTLTSYATARTYNPSIGAGGGVFFGVDPSNATADTYDPLVGIYNSTAAGSSIAEANTLVGTLYTSKVVEVLGGISYVSGTTFTPDLLENAIIQVTTSYATAITLPFASSDIEETGRRLIDGYPYRSEVRLRNRKVVVLNGKLAYKIADNYFTKKL